MSYLFLSAPAEPEFITAAPRTWLRAEGAALGLGATALYATGGHSWLVFAALFLAPDLSFAAYSAGPGSARRSITPCIRRFPR